MNANELELRIDDEGWHAIVDVSKFVDKAFSAAIMTQASMTNPLGVTIVLANNEAVEQLNSQWRAKQKPTNILSFPAPTSEKTESGIRYIGDMILALAVIEQEADEQGKALETHLCHLVIHGALHLLGYDHLNDKQACIMEDLERTAMKTLGLADPYLSADERLAIKTEV